MGLDDWGQSAVAPRLFPLLTALVELGVPVLTVMIGPVKRALHCLGLHLASLSPGPNKLVLLGHGGAVVPWLPASGRHGGQRAARRWDARGPRCWRGAS